jgi:pimeloyl-ACP methyl ester carboxylesterase
LDKCIDLALSKNPEAARVNILAHSMGGLVARAYLAEPDKAQKVQRLVTLGSPFLGAPIILLAILDQLCFAEWIGLCFTNTEVLHELIQNYPAGYQIAPGMDYSQVYVNGFYRRDRDGDGDGLRDGYLGAEAVYRLLSEHNPELTQKAQAQYTRVGAWANGGTNGVDVVSIVGDQHASMGTLVEYDERPWYDPWGEATIAYRTEPVNGDGTVTLHSADLRDPARGIDLTGGARVLYFNLDHGELPKDLSVLKLAAQIFAGEASLDLDALIQLPTSSGAAQDVGPRTEPLPLNGAWLTVSGPVEVEIRDSAGNEIKSGAQTANNSGATISQMGETFFLFLPQGDRYEVRLLGQQQSAADVRIQQITGDQTAQTILFEDLPVTDKSQAHLLLDTVTTGLANFSLDQDGDGVIEAVFPPAAVLNAQESLDTTPPVTLITVQGALLPDGRYMGPVRITLTAQDNPGGAGVAKIEYSLNGGKTVLPYSDPFEVDPNSVAIILARATDRAGNEEEVLASARLAPVRIFIPSLIR